MQVKKFRQPTVRDAFREIRDEFGPSALVLGSELVAARGWRGWVGMREVQVTASAPEGWGEITDSRPAVLDGRSADIPAGTGGLTAVTGSVTGSGAASGSGVGSLAARLMAAGIDPALAEAVAAGVPVKQQRKLDADGVRQALATHLASLATGDEAFARVEVFIGPPGVGKTTTIAKIAAQEKVRRKRAVGVVAADAFRAGAVEQLRTYAAIIGAPFRTARTIEEMDQAIDQSRQTLLVDTAGRSPKDDDLRDVRRLLGSRRGVRTHLVIPAETSLTAAARIVDRFADAKPDRVVVSRLDEAEAPTALLTWLVGRGLPVSYLTTGQRVPEDLERATPAMLAATLLRDEPAPSVLGLA